MTLLSEILSHKNRFLKTIILFFSFVVLGATIAVIGPTLLDLRQAVNADSLQISVIFPIGSVGYLLGSIAGGVVYEHFDSQLSIAFFVLIMTVCNVVIPWNRSIISLSATQFVMGLGGGGLDTAGNVWLLHMWGKKSAPFMQALHFTFGLGAFIAPLIAEPFLSNKKNITESGEEVEVLVGTAFEDLMIWCPYTIIAGLGLATIISLVIMYFIKSSDKPHPSIQNNESLIIMTLKQKVLILLIASIIFHSYCGLEIAFGRFMTTFAFYSDLHLNKSIGAYMTSVFWGTFTLCRLLTIFIVDSVGTTAMIWADILIVMTSNIVLIIFDLVTLSPQFVSALHNHRYFSDEMKTVVQKLSTDGEKILFILVWFTRSRSTCDEIIRLLWESGQKEASQRLTHYNTSNGHMEFRIHPDIPLRECNAPMIGSLYYQMMRKPRGKCIIINNVPKEVYMETDRFKHIFEKLHFKVKPCFDWTAQQIEENLRKSSEKMVKSDAFILMIVSHGLEEQILGSDACEGIRILSVDPNNTEAQRLVNTDVIDIKRIVDIFSDKNCPILRNVPKIFYFTCCRNSFANQLSEQQKPVEESKNLAKPFVEVVSHEKRSFPNMKSLDEQWVDDNKDTFICYSCAEGHKSYYDEMLGITHFGQALSHTIAQYACEETLTSIMSRTCDFLQQFFEETGCYAPEFRGKGLRRQLSFNP
ncbi:unnamed protein product [Oppiella nova]|uniref:Caspase family p20 domain-containing protein n=1 Tax=Oppiella nova TaxID=334625 RepID=A0A7R9LNT0_9ACAR|nr:unnamed protein product [Oppiella nova]CAG2164876.1 unnamed protein product [Oppiella nova]